MGAARSRVGGRNADRRTALIVGGAKGIGEACGELFAERLSDVVVADIDRDAGEVVASRLRGKACNALAVGLDVANQGEVDAAIERAIETTGRLDSVIYAPALLSPEPLETCSMERWSACFRVNVEGALRVARAAFPFLCRSPAPSIVNIGSLSGVWPRPNGGSYGPSKAALVSLSGQLAVEWARFGIRVNVVNPGTIDTALARAAVGEGVLRQRSEAIPLRRIGTPAEVAELVFFLASPRASYVTAQAINCDGGFSATLMNAHMGSGSEQTDPSRESVLVSQ